MIVLCLDHFHLMRGFAANEVKMVQAQYDQRSMTSQALVDSPVGAHE